LKLSNICDDTFKLLDEPLECTSENCPCWKSMIVCEEERWTHLWLDDWELP
jgi:molybdopterin synthase catalytic subunit